MTNPYTWLVFLHILAAMIWVGGAVYLNVLVSRVVRQGQPDAVAQFTTNITVLGPRLFAPTILVVLGTGIWMVMESWEFAQLWVQMSVTLFIAAVLVGAVQLSRTSIAAGRAVGSGDHSEAVRQLRQWAWGFRLVLLLLVAATWAMVFKPGL
jgi:uncharacterized membrane protein